MSSFGYPSMVENSFRTVFDTGIVLATAFDASGFSMRAIRLMETGEITAFVSNRLRYEYESLLHNPAHLKRYPFLFEAQRRLTYSTPLQIAVKLH